MYTRVKRIIKKVLPESVFKKYSSDLRLVNTFLFYGNQHQCNICQSKLRKFVTENTKKICPVCGSLGRTRNVYKLINDQHMLTGKVLHFSPPASLVKKFSKVEGIKYYPTDYLNEFNAPYQFDIRNLAFKDETVDLIICYHVLEHIDQDKKAMQELYRVLAKNGILLIQTPFKEGNIYEDPRINSPEERKTAFGQEDHVRIYSLEGLKNRFKEVNPLSTISSITNKSNDYHGLTADQVIVIKKRIC